MVVVVLVEEISSPAQVAVPKGNPFFKSLYLCLLMFIDNLSAILFQKTILTVMLFYYKLQYLKRMSPVRLIILNCAILM